MTLHRSASKDNRIQCRWGVLVLWPPSSPTSSAMQLALDSLCARSFVSQVSVFMSLQSLLMPSLSLHLCDYSEPRSEAEHHVCDALHTFALHQHAAITGVHKIVIELMRCAHSFNLQRECDVHETERKSVRDKRASTEQSTHNAIAALA